MRASWCVYPVLLACLAAGCISAPPLPTFGAVPEFSLTTSSNAELRRETLLGQPWIASFGFTRCAGPCPLMSARMQALGARIPPTVRRVSISVDPEYDTPEVLAAYAASFSATEPEWTFAVGTQESTHDLVVKGFKLGLARTPDDDPRAAAEPITHSTRFTLVDASGEIRGYYDPFAPDGLDQLARDVRRLLKEQQ